MSQALATKTSAGAAVRNRATAAALPVILTGIFMPVLDFFIVNVAIPSTQRDLHASAAAIQWIVAGYGLAYGSGLIAGGRVGDLYGRRQMFALGMILFTVASAACVLAPSAGALVAARILQGAAAALLAPQVLAILRITYQGAALARAIAAYGLSLGLASVFGQLVGGALIEAGLSWRACFLINVPVGIAALALTRHAVPATSRMRGARVDLGGMALITLAVALILPLIEGREQHWPLWTWLSLAAAPVIVSAYAGRRHAVPLIDLAVFRDRAFSVGVLATLAFTMGMAGYFLVFALFVQQGRGLDPLQAGLIFTPLGAGYLITSLTGPRLSARYGHRLIAVGGLMRILGLSLILLTVSHVHSVTWLIPALAIDGAGMGLCLAPLAGVVLARVASRHAGLASGVLGTAQQLGGAIGVALIGIVFYGALGSSGYTHAFQFGVVYVMAVAAAMTVLVQWLPRR
jgi:EmrB/QacA subfamily drug resistance transporter